MATSNHTPPRWAEKLLEWYCKPEVFEDLQGDLLEYFDRHVKELGPRRAKLVYVIDVIKFFRSYTVRKPNFVNSLIHLIMIKSYIKSSGRNILRHKLFSSINIIGLAISMSVGLLVIGMLSDLFSYDKFHEKHSRIYRINSQFEYKGNKDNDSYATTSLKAAKALKEGFANIEAVAIFKRDFGGDFSHKEKVIPMSGFWAEEGMFNVFSFPLIEGNPKKALKDPFSIILTESAARKMFGDESAIGKTLILNKDREYTVTGILKDIPKNSHIQFEVLGSLNTRDIIVDNQKNEMSWTAMWDTWTYLLLPENGDAASVDIALQKFAASENEKDKYSKVYLSLQPMDKIMAGEKLNNDIGTVAGRMTVWIFSVLAILVVFSAGLNYTNLSIARALKRTKEIGIRKTIGATRHHVVFQFIVESVIISVLALVVSFGIFLVIKPHFIGLEHSFRKLLTLNLSPQLVLYFIAFAVTVGIAAGLFPALFFARISPLKVLKNFGNAPRKRGINARKALIVFQFFLSIIGITTTIISYKQYKHFTAYDLGFYTENILNIELKGNKPEILKKEFLELPEVKDISQSKLITGVGEYWGTTVKNPNDPADSTGIYYNTVDDHYIPLHHHQLIAGQNFTMKNGDSEETEVIVNESVIKRFNLSKGDPAKAIDQIVTIDKKPLRIIGVVKDFTYGTANSRAGKEVVIRYSNGDANYLNLQILSTDWVATHEKLEKIWKKIDPVHPFKAQFYSDQIQQSFAGMKASIRVAGFLAFLVICIASIGLLGMVVFTTETRIKEVSIRKVLGSTDGNLILLLGRSFFILIGVAGGLAVPLSYIFFENIFLPEIANHAPINLFEVSVGFIVVATIAFILICSQTLKVVKKNPAEVLKTE